jgi:hypothetical protein
MPRFDGKFEKAEVRGRVAALAVAVADDGGM